MASTDSIKELVEEFLKTEGIDAQKFLHNKNIAYNDTFLEEFIDELANQVICTDGKPEPRKDWSLSKKLL